MGNVPRRIISDTSPFVYKIRVFAVSMMCPRRIHPVFRHHSRLVDGTNVMRLEVLNLFG